MSLVLMNWRFVSRLVKSAGCIRSARICVAVNLPVQIPCRDEDFAEEVIGEVLHEGYGAEEGPGASIELARSRFDIVFYVRFARKVRD